MGRTRPFIVPVCVDDTPETDADVPDAFAAVQWTRLHNEDARPAFVKRVLQLLSAEAAHAPGEVRSPAAPAVSPTGAALGLPVPSPAAPRPTQRVLLLIAAVAVIGVGYFAVDKLWLSKRSAADAQTLSSTIQAGTPPQGAIPEKSVAVLPFIDMSEKKDQEYFSDGLTEELIDLLAQGPGPAGAGPHLVLRLQGQGGRCRRALLRNCASPTSSKGACGRLATRCG